MKNRRWDIRERVPAEIVAHFPELHPKVLQLLYNRGIKNQESIDEFFNPDYASDLHDPFLFRDMEKVVGRLFKAVASDELIVVYGDYDVDGVCGAAIMLAALERLGARHLHVHLPHREKEGYGLNMAAVEEFIRMGARVLVTVDCGIANVEEVASASKGGLEVIVVDHHQQKKTLPEAFAIIHSGLPQESYPFKNLSGGGTAFKVAQALLRRTLESNEAFEKWLLDLAALATVADMVPLLGENRTMVTYGLKVLNKTSRVGLRSLMDVAGIALGRISVEDISWRLAPRLNAAGRMDHANAALALVRTVDPHEAENLAQGINVQNAERQRTTERMVAEIKSQIGDIKDARRAVYALDASWQVSLLGLAAGRIVEQYNRPAFIMTRVEDKIMGSGRSIQGIDLVEMLGRVHERVPLVRFGGHAQACGFTLEAERFFAFTQELERVSGETLEGFDLVPGLTIDAEIPPEHIDWDFIEKLASFSPHGVGNPVPVFLVKNLTIAQKTLVGNGEKHLKLKLKNGSGRELAAIGFGLANGWSDQLSIGTAIDIACELGVNEWNGNRELQIKIKDLRLQI